MRDPNGPPTADQRSHAKRLGIEIPKGVTKLALSELIYAAKDTRKPTSAMQSLAGKLGIRISGMSFDEAADALNDAVADRAARAMRDNTALRVGRIIMYQDLPFRVSFVGKRGKRYIIDVVPLRAVLSQFRMSRRSRPSTYKEKSVLILDVVDVREVSERDLRQFMEDYFKKD